MKIAIRKDENGVVQIDRYICENYAEDEVRSLGYEILHIDDKYKEFEAEDFNTDLIFDESKYLSRIKTIEINERIAELKELLSNTDYKAIKYAEGEMTPAEYEPIREQRKAWRNEINKLEKR